jgi:predicted  nucleic acid-binding Zn-ribbon protein
MGLVIQNLLWLQELDLEIVSLIAQKANLLSSVNKKKSELDEHRRHSHEHEEELKRLKVHIKKLDVDLTEATDRIRKLESQQIHVKTNQEYKALDKEIYEAKAHKAQTEDLMLQKMELLEQGGAAISDFHERADSLVAQLHEETAKVDGEIRRIDDRITELRTKRSEIAAGIEDKHIRLYNRIFKNKGGPAIVPLVNRACQGCHLAVPAAVESILRRDEADIITCENCSRILYIPDKEENSG